MKKPMRSVGGAAVAVVAALLLVGAIGLSQSDEQPDRRAEPAQPSMSEAGESRPPETTAATPTPPARPELLLPNMRSLDASDLSIEVVGDGRRLRFAASLANVGAGPLLVEPLDSTGCAADQRGAEQALFADRNGDGRFQRQRARIAERRFAGCMLDHPGHDHWHFDAMAAYSLSRPGAEQPLVARDKVSFCLRDNEKVPGAPNVVPREHFGECAPDGPQGISPGWVDIYTAELDGQWLAVPDSVRSERLCLGLEADPLDRLVETDEGDNATAIGIEITGTSVRRVNGVACG